MQTATGDFHQKKEGNKQPISNMQGERQSKKKAEGDFIPSEDKQREHIEQIQNH